MYGLRSDIDLSFLINASLLDLGIGSGEFVLRFENYSSIRICASFGITRHGSSTLYNGGISDGVALIPIVGNSITKINPNEKSLQLKFSDETIVEIFDDSDKYESFIITHKDIQIIV